MATSRRSFLDRLAAHDRFLRILAAVLGTVVVALLDLATGPDVAFSLFYLVPVAATAWYFGKIPGLAIATFASLSWLLVEVLSSPPVVVAIPLWNGLSRLGMFAALALVLARLRKERTALVVANRRLDQQNHDLDAFAGRVAHDLRNAMAPISLAAHSLRSHANAPEKISLLADRVDASCRKSMLIISSLLALAKAQNPQAQTSDTLLLEAVNAVMKDLDEEIAREAIQVCVEVDPELTVRCDAGLLHIVLANLLGNAVKYMGSHPRPRRVHVLARTHVQWVEISIADTGPGIPLEEQARVFEPFYRGQLAGSPGTGIGLATVERIVLSQGGTISLHSDGSHGACFRVSLPAAGPKPR